MKQNTLAIVIVVLIGIVVLAVGSVYFGVWLDTTDRQEPRSKTTLEHSDSQESSQPTSLTDDSGGKPPQLAKITVASYDWSSDGNDTLGLDFHLQIHGYEDLRYENVLVCLYARNGTVVGKDNLGSVYSPTSQIRSLEVSSSIRPAWIIVDHPQLRNDSRFQTEISGWNDEERLWVGYLGPPSRLDNLQDEFEFPRSSEVGTCG